MFRHDVWNATDCGILTGSIRVGALAPRVMKQVRMDQFNNPEQAAGPQAPMPQLAQLTQVAPAVAEAPVPQQAQPQQPKWRKRSLPVSIFKLVVAVVLIVATIFSQGIATVWAYYNLWDLDPLMIDVAYEVSGSLVVIIAMAILGGLRYWHFDHKKIAYALKSCWWMLLVDTSLGIWDLTEYLSEGTELVPNWQLRIVLIVVICLGVGISEEGMFRGLALGGLLGPLGTKKSGVVAACIISSLAFGFIHVIPFETTNLNMFDVAQMILKTLQTGICGLIWAAVAVRSDNMWGVALAHGLTDLPLMVTEAIFSSSDMSTEYVASGEEEAISTIIMYLVIIVLYLPLVVKSVKILRETEAPDYGPFVKDTFQPEAFVSASKLGTKPMMLATAAATVVAPGPQMGVGMPPSPTAGAYAQPAEGQQLPQQAPMQQIPMQQVPTQPAAWPAQGTYPQPGARPEGVPVPPTGWHDA